LKGKKLKTVEIYEKKWPKGKVFLADCREILPKLESNSIDLILTDPPYFIDGMGDDWDRSKLETKTSKAGVIGGRPIGMKFDVSQGYAFQEFLAPVFKESFRILKPGGFLISFSQARLFHRLAVAAEDEGFEIRDMLAWHHNGQAKAFTQDHFVRKNKNLSEKEKAQLLKQLGGRKTPQLKPQLEPMVLAQKPKEGTFVDNWMKYEVGLIDTSQSLDGTFPGNLMAVAKPGKAEKGTDNIHLTVKPTALLSHLIKIFTVEGAVVLDPFLGSGSTAVAAVASSRNFIGIERDEDYFEISTKRIEESMKKS
jgi:site-specific DNA-methyltransferase (adenine-specific)